LKQVVCAGKITMSSQAPSDSLPKKSGRPRESAKKARIPGKNLGGSATAAYWGNSKWGRQAITPRRKKTTVANFA
jgi:hypothetical protein